MSSLPLRFHGASYPKSGSNPSATFRVNLGLRMLPWRLRGTMGNVGSCDELILGRRLTRLRRPRLGLSLEVFRLPETNSPVKHNGLRSVSYFSRRKNLIKVRVSVLTVMKIRSRCRPLSRSETNFFKLYFCNFKKSESHSPIALKTSAGSNERSTGQGGLPLSTVPGSIFRRAVPGLR